MKNEPLVSIIIPTYKRSNMLSRAIDSVLNQTYKNVEIIVVDDNNENTQYRRDTEIVMKKYKENHKVKYIKHSKNMNGAVARNTGIKNSRGEYIGFLDDDDIYYKEKIQKQVEYLEKNIEYDAVYCARKVKNFEHRPRKHGDLTFEILSGQYLVITFMFLMKKGAAVKCGGWEESFSRNQEAAFLLKFFDKGYKIGYIDEVLCETDLSDRSNASNPQKNEDDMLYLLNFFDYVIQKHKKDKFFFKTRIYAYRSMGIVLSYLANKQYKNFINRIIVYLFRYNIFFSYYMVKYTICKILKISQNGYYIATNK